LKRRLQPAVAQLSRSLGAGAGAPPAPPAPADAGAGAGAGGSGPEARMREIAAQVARDCADGARELAARFGGEGAAADASAHVAAFMSDFYKGRPDYAEARAGAAAGAPAAGAPAAADEDAGAEGARLLVPAFAQACQDARLRGAPPLEAKAAVFFAHALRAGGVPARNFSPTCAQMTLAPGTDHALLLAVLRLVDSPVGRAVAERVALSVRRSGNRALIEAGQHVARVPLELPVDRWPLPQRERDARRLLALARARAGDAPAEPFEATAVFARARGAVPLHSYLLIAASSVLECQWAAFYATGDKRFVRRVADIAADWAEAERQLPDAVAYLLDSTKPLPAEVAPDAAACERAGEGSAEAAALESARSARAQISRAAAWSLLLHARRHPRVTEALAEECARLAQFAADPAARDAPALERSDLTEAAARARLEVLPALLHLIARQAADASR